MSVIEYFYAAHSAYAYIGSERLMAIARAAGRRLEHRPIDLARVMQAAGSPSFKERPLAVKEYFFNREMERWMEFRGVRSLGGRPTYHHHSPDLANRVIVAAIDAGHDVDDLAHRMLEAHWAEDADLADEPTLVTLANACGLDGDALLAAADSAPVRAAYEANTADAVERSVFGSPTYFVDGDMFYGQDRLELVERALEKPFAHLAAAHGVISTARRAPRPPRRWLTMAPPSAHESYLRFALANRRFLGFGFFIALASSFGQTYFIGVFGPALQDEFALSHTAWSTIYMAGTLASAALLPWSGKLIDRFDLRLYTAAVSVLFVAACAVTAAATGPLTLVLAIFALRQSGQGLFSHVALTSMARYFDAGRGRGIAIASLGFAAGEAMLPLAAVALIAAVGWRHTYVLIGVLVLVAVAPVALWLLRGHGERHRAHERRLSAAARGDAPSRRSWSRGEMLRDARFWLLLPAVLSPSLIVTALFFHHLNLADAKGWSHAWITGNYVLYAAATVATALVVGPLVDRLGALRVLPALLAPIALALVVVALGDAAWIVVPYLALLGLSSGVTQTLLTAMWAELYGVMHLGAIKSLVTALRVFISALGPVSAGVLMDAGVTLDMVCLGYVGLAAAATVLMLMALARPAATA